MSIINEQNRPQETIMLHSLTKTETFPFFLAGKQVILNDLKFLTTVRQGKSSVTYLTLQFQKMAGTTINDLGDAWDTEHKNTSVGNIVEIEDAKNIVLLENESLLLKVTAVVAARSSISWAGNVVKIGYTVVGY